MRRTGLALGLAALGVLAPAGAAQADSFSGSCTFQPGYALTEDAYTFGGGTVNGVCSGTVNSVEGGYEVVWQSSGSGSFSCTSGVFQQGSSRLTFYRVAVEAPGQPRTLVGTLDLLDGPGVATNGQVRRLLRGALLGSAAESGRLRGDCDGGAYEGSLTTLSPLVD